MYKLLSIALCFSFLWGGNAIGFDGVSLSSNPTSLDDHIKPGKWTLVAVWELDCVYCEQQKPDLSELHISNKQLSVIGLSIDGVKNLTSVKKRLSEKPVSFTNLVANFDQFQREYASRYNSEYVATPTYILYTPSKNVDSVHVGPINFSSLVAHIQKNTKPKHIAPSTDLMR